MEQKYQVHNLIILDESGSMQSIKNLIIQGFNEIVQTIKGSEKQNPDQKHYISFLTFNGWGIKWIHFVEPANMLNQIDGEKYRPNASTPLFDAMGYGINKLRNWLDNQSNYNVLVTVFTDGEENSSKEYSSSNIKSLVEELKQKNWTFTYIGTDHNVHEVALSISINNVLHFERNEQHIKQMFERERKSRQRYMNYLTMFHEINPNTFNYFDDTDLDDLIKK